jgi:hypothetical protein
LNEYLLQRLIAVAMLPREISGAMPATERDGYCNQCFATADEGMGAETE